jgi:hypothetical protein
VAAICRQGSESNPIEKETNVSHPQMLYYLAVTQIEEAQRLADRARRITETVKLRRARRAEAIEVVTVPEVSEKAVERVPSLV